MSRLASGADTDVDWICWPTDIGARRARKLAGGRLQRVTSLSASLFAGLASSALDACHSAAVKLCGLGTHRLGQAKFLRARPSSRRARERERDTLPNGFLAPPRPLPQALVFLAKIAPAAAIVSASQFFLLVVILSPAPELTIISVAAASGSAVQA